MRRDDIVRLFEHHDAVLHDVREGVLIVDGTGRLMLINDEARRRLAIAAEAEVDGQLLEEIGLESGMAELFTSNHPLSDAPAGSTGRPPTPPPPR
jgi:sensor histidine kinase regulating citrate/malate metabolism